MCPGLLGMPPGYWRGVRHWRGTLLVQCPSLLLRAVVSAWGVPPANVHSLAAARAVRC